jgi:hypothetical protein
MTYGRRSRLGSSRFIRHLKVMLQLSVRHRLMRSLLDTLTGALVCTWLALTAALVGQTWPWPPELLALLIPSAAVVARVWGFAGAMLGLVSALTVFRVGFFDPIGRLEVASADTNTSLFWVILGSSIAAYVFARPLRIPTEIRGHGSC